MPSNIDYILSSNVFLKYLPTVQRYPFATWIFRQSCCPIGSYRITFSKSGSLKRRSPLVPIPVHLGKSASTRARGAMTKGEKIVQERKNAAPIPAWTNTLYRRRSPNGVLLIVTTSTRPGHRRGQSDCFCLREMAGDDREKENALKVRKDTAPTTSRTTLVERCTRTPQPTVLNAMYTGGRMRSQRIVPGAPLPTPRAMTTGTRRMSRRRQVAVPY